MASTPAPGSSRSSVAPDARWRSSWPTSLARTARPRSASTAPTTASSRSPTGCATGSAPRAATSSTSTGSASASRTAGAWCAPRTRSPCWCCASRPRRRRSSPSTSGSSSRRSPRPVASSADSRGPMAGSIVVRGARAHNLKNIDVEIPRDRFVVITGLSGSGKSSLAFDTLYAEGQRRYVESLSAYARQFLEQMEKPDCDGIEGLSPAIALAKGQRHTVEVLVDRRVVQPGTERRLADSLAVAFREGGGIVVAEASEPGAAEPRALLFSERHACPVCGVSYPELSPRFFSFNSPHGACPACGGLGVQRRFDPALVVARPEKPLPAALAPAALRALPGFEATLAALAEQYRFRPETPFAELPAPVRSLVLDGSGEQEVEIVRRRNGRRQVVRRPFPGILALLERRARQTHSSWLRDELEGLVTDRPCPACEGTRLRRETRFVRVGGRNIVEVSALPIAAAAAFFRDLELSPAETEIARPILKEVIARLGFLVDVGLDYLALDRGAATLSGGEGQRIRLATQIGSRLVGVLYILDEPSIGLHPRDNARLLAMLRELRDLGNSVIVVEHDRETILAADHVVDMGPGAGVGGGHVVATGPPAAVMANPASLTGRYLSGAEEIPVPAPRRRGSAWSGGTRGARANNPQDVDVDFLLSPMICVTGVSGSGKSTLVIDTLHRALARRLGGGREEPGAHRELVGWQLVDKVIEISQAPIGRSPRSNPATYTGAFAPLRDLFAQLPEARARGYGPGRFSFNVKGGRCEACAGEGMIPIEMHFLPDVFVTCEVCGGRRYNRETLEVQFKGLSIADVLDLTVAEALDVLGNVPAARVRLEALREVGLEYIRLGQPGTTLSGGEAQRVKLARELARRPTGRTLYVLDEPTTGLHFDDVRLLLVVVGHLVDVGTTVLLLEQNVEVITNSDHVNDRW